MGAFFSRYHGCDDCMHQALSERLTLLVSIAQAKKITTRLRQQVSIQTKKESTRYVQGSSGQSKLGNAWNYRVYGHSLAYHSLQPIELLHSPCGLFLGDIPDFQIG